MSQRRYVACLLLLAACGGGNRPPAPEPVAAAATPETAVQSFMKAVADSNLTVMAQYWGTGKGPAALTGEPGDYQRRMLITQLYLRATPYRILRTDPSPDDQSRQVVTVELDRHECTKVVPFTTVKTSQNGWIVLGIDLGQAGTPGRPCAKPAPNT